MGASRGRNSVEEKDGVGFMNEGHLQSVADIFEDAENAEDWSWVNGLTEGFVVEADVAAGDGNLQCFAGFADSFDGFAELKHHFGALGIAEIEAIGGGDGIGARARDVAGGLGDGVHGPEARIQKAPTAFAIGGERQGAPTFLQAQDAGVASAGNDSGVGLHLVIILANDPVFGSDGGRCE